MKLRFICLLPLMLLSCNKTNATINIPQAVDGASASYTVVIDQTIVIESNKIIENHQLKGKYDYVLKIEDGFYNIKIEPDFFYFDDEPIEFFDDSTAMQTDFSIPISRNIKKTVSSLFKKEEESFNGLMNPGSIFESSVLGMIPQLSKIKNKQHISILEESIEAITLSRTDVFKMPNIQNLEHNIECTNTTVETISKRTGLLINSETNSVSYGMIFAPEEGGDPLGVTINAKIVYRRSE